MGRTYGSSSKRTKKAKEQTAAQVFLGMLSQVKSAPLEIGCVPWGEKEPQHNDGCIFWVEKNVSELQGGSQSTMERVN